MNYFGTFTKLRNNVGDLSKIILTTIFKWLPKVQKIAQSGHTGWDQFTTTLPIKKQWKTFYDIWANFEILPRAQIWKVIILFTFYSFSQTRPP